MPDHIDGTCLYTEKGGDDKNFNHFDTSLLPLDLASGEKQIIETKDDWYRKVLRRQLEMEILVKDVCKPTFAKEVLKLGRMPKIDLKKVVVAGHELGATIALLAGDKDKRVSAVMAHDPWLPVIEDLLEPHWQGTTALKKKDV